VNRSNLNVRLYEHRDSTSVFIEAEIDSNGQLLISGQDIGDAPKEHCEDSDYEYWIVVPSEQKDCLLLILLQELYSGNSKIISDFLSLLKSRGIGHIFESYA
jgi:hypothetical protein